MKHQNKNHTINIKQSLNYKNKEVRIFYFIDDSLIILLMDSSNQKLAEAEQLERLVATTSNIQKTLEMLFGNSDVIESQENQVGSI